MKLLFAVTLLLTSRNMFLQLWMIRKKLADNGDSFNSIVRSAW